MADTHGGSGADHLPVLRQVNLSGPTGLYPGEQDTSTIVPVWYLDSRGETPPFGGRPGDEQETIPRKTKSFFYDISFFLKSIYEIIQI